jgi:hypothetical protein
MFSSSNFFTYSLVIAFRFSDIRQISSDTALAKQPGPTMAIWWPSAVKTKSLELWTGKCSKFKHI